MQPETLMINLELIFSDIEYLERRIEKTKKAAKSGDKTLLAEVKFYEKIMGVLEAGRSARTVEIDDSERQFTKELNLLSAKPVLYVANISDSDIGNDENNVHVKQVADIAASEEAEWVSVSAEIEEEIAALEEDERADFLEDLGLAESGLDKIIAAGYRLLGLISFLQSAKTKCAHGRSQRDLKPLRQQVKFTQTFSEDLSGQKLSLTMI